MTSSKISERLALLARIAPQSVSAASVTSTYVSPATMGLFGKLIALAHTGQNSTGDVTVSHDGGTTYEVTYDFQYNPDGWQPVIQYIDPLTGRPHPDASPVTATVYASINFQNLGL